MSKSRWPYAAILCVMLGMLLPTAPVAAAGSTVSFSTAITYQNTGSTVAQVTILFYPEGATTPISIARPNLAVGASATVSVGSLSSSGFKGSAVVKSDGQLSVVMTEIPSDTSIKSRPNATGFRTGNGDFWFLNLVKSSDHSVFTVQNIDSSSADLTLTFYGSGTPVTIAQTGLASGATHYFDLAQLSELTSTSYNAVHVIAKRSNGETGKIIGTLIHLAADPFYDSAIESLTQTGNVLYYPIARCGGTAGRSTKYFIFNPDASNSTTVTLTYSSGRTAAATVSPLSAAWFDTCSNTGNASFNGSAQVTSSATDILGLGYYFNGGLNTQFYGMAVGSYKLAVPLASYSASCWTTGNRQCTEILIMNLGSSLASGAVTVKYYDKNGNLVGTHTLGAINSGNRGISTPADIGSAGAEFGYYADGTSGGSAVIEGPAGSNLIAAVFTSWIAGTNLHYGEIYNAIPISIN